MPGDQIVQSVTVASGGTTSGSIELAVDRASYIVIEVPTIDLATIEIDGSDDDVTFRRMRKTDGSATWSIAASTGGFFLPVDISRWLPKFVRIVLGAAQAGGARVFKVIQLMV